MSEQLTIENAIYTELDEFSKKRISLHKVAIHDNQGNIIRHDYHMVIIDLCMTINITLGETSIINLIKSLKQ